MLPDYGRPTCSDVHCRTADFGSLALVHDFLNVGGGSIHLVLRARDGDLVRTEINNNTGPGLGLDLVDFLEPIENRAAPLVGIDGFGHGPVLLGLINDSPHHVERLPNSSCQPLALDMDLHLVHIARRDLHLLRIEIDLHTCLRLGPNSSHCAATLTDHRTAPLTNTDEAPTPVGGSGYG